MDMVSLIITIFILLALMYAWLKKMLISQMIVVINFIIFIVLLISSKSFSISSSAVAADLAFRPSYLNSPSSLYTLFTSMFLHWGFLHIIGNMIVLLLIGIPFEHRVGRKKFMLIYLLSGIAGTLFFSVAEWGSTVLTGGASGAIFGILGAFAAAYPWDEVVMPIPAFIVFFVRMKVIVAAVLFGLLQVVLAVAEQYFPSKGLGGIAYLAHLGGLVAGIILSVIVIKKEVPQTRAEFEFKALEGLLTTEKQKEIFRKIKEADFPEVREAWVSQLLRELKCSRCGGTIKKDGSCSDCGYRLWETDEFLE